MPLCVCGCGQEIKEGNKFMVGHSRRGIPMSEDHKRKIGLSNSISKKGKPNGLKGIPKSEEHKRKLSEYHKGKIIPEETRLKISNKLKGRKKSEDTKRKMRENHADVKKEKNPLYGKHHTDETKKKLSNLLKGRFITEETKQKMSLARKGKTFEEIYGTEEAKRIKKEFSEKRKGDGNNFFGKKHSDETKKKISLKHLDMDFYLKHGYAKSKEPYDDGFSKEIKEDIAKRDSFTCQICNELLPDKFAVHHIDYNKKNCNENNLIFLCRSCHSKTNHNREFWETYLMEDEKACTSS